MSCVSKGLSIEKLTRICINSVAAHGDIRGTKLVPCLYVDAKACNKSHGALLNQLRHHAAQNGRLRNVLTPDHFDAMPCYVASCSGQRLPGVGHQCSGSLSREVLAGWLWTRQHRAPDCEYLFLVYIVDITDCMPKDCFAIAAQGCQAYQAS